MTAETQVTANAVVPDATRADTAYLAALERITLQMTGKLQLDDVLATITHGLVEEFHAAFARLWLLGPGDLCTACYQAGDCANRERCLHLKASAGSGRWSKSTAPPCPPPCSRASYSARPPPCRHRASPSGSAIDRP
jgi:hypothetical protein